MLTVVSGPYHPSLEENFYQRIVELKRDPLTPVAVVTPSARLKERVEILLSERGVSALNVVFHTFASLAQGIVDAASPLQKPIWTDASFYDALVKKIIKEDKPFGDFEDLAVPDGFPPAVRGALQDLLEAGVDEKNASEAIREEFLGRGVDVGSLRELLRLYRIYLKRIQALPVVPRLSLVKKATALAPASGYLEGFREIIYYGFYDLTGIQTDFFHAVVKNHPSRFYFPYVHENPAYAFAARFRDNFLQPVIHGEVRLEPEEKMPAPFTIINVSGLKDEAWTLAQEILRCRNDGVPFERMAIIYRSKERITDRLLSTLRQHGIPYRSSVARSLASSPTLNCARQLLRTVDPNAEASGDFLAHPDFLFPDGAGFERPLDFPEKASWPDFAKAAADMLDRYFKSRTPETAAIWAAVKADLEKMSAYDYLSAGADRAEFFDALDERWSRLELPDDSRVAPGVSILFAEAARGLPFKVIFIAGVEERVFPRVIREDPFLRDDARLALVNTLGHKISQKMTAHEEERLLFQLFTAAAEKLFILYQRSDDEGNVVGPSTFVRSFAAERGVTLDAAARSVPRATSSKLEAASPLTLDRHAIVARLLSVANRPRALAFLKKESGGDIELARQLEFVDRLHRRGEPGDLDGIIGPSFQGYVFGHPLSPSSLESFGECPFKFFATRLLRLEPLETPSSEEALEPRVEGQLVHRFLEYFYRRLTANGTLFLPEKIPDDLFESVFREVFEDPNGLIVDDQPVKIHPILWDALKAAIKAELRQFIERDVADCRAGGFSPLYFEHDVTTSLPPPLDGIEWHGVMDRLDAGAEAARVVDYKTGRFFLSHKPGTLVIRGRKAQPPLYILLAEKVMKESGRPAAEAVHFVYKRVRDDAGESPALSLAEWKANRKEILATMETQLDLMRRGVFSIYPDEAYCGRCDVAQMCRRMHGPSAFRATQGDGQRLRGLRAKRLAKKKEETR